MTRGKICVATEDKLLYSVEFNGDMYVEHGYGEEVINAFNEGITNEQEYREYVEAFDNENFNYATEKQDENEYNYFNNEYFIKGVRQENLEDKETMEMLDFTTNYFDKWFSDYIYLKNIDNERDLVITCNLENEDGRKEKAVTVTIRPKGYVTLDFGSLVKEHSENYEIVDGEEDFDEYCEFDGYWAMTASGIIVYDTDNDRQFDLTEVDGGTIDHIVDYVREGYVRGDIYGARKERV